MKDENWETQEVIDWIINDGYCYIETLGEDADTIESFVREGNAPAGLYESFARQTPTSSLDSVNWNAVAEACAE